MVQVNKLGVIYDFLNSFKGRPVIPLCLHFKIRSLGLWALGHKILVGVVWEFMMVQ